MCVHPQGVADSESRRAGDLAEAAYKESFDAAIAADENALMAEHQVRACTHCMQHV